MPTILCTPPMPDDGDGAGSGPPGLDWGWLVLGILYLMLAWADN